jgi:hypothetical protein
MLQRTEHGIEGPDIFSLNNEGLLVSFCGVEKL